MSAVFDFVPRALEWAEEWESLVSNSPDGWVFSLSCWQDLIGDVREWGLEELSFGIRQSGKLIAVVPLHYNPNNNRVQSSGWGGSGPVLAKGLSPKQRRKLMFAAIQRCLELAKTRQAAFFDFNCSPVTRSSLENVWGVTPFQYHGLKDVSGISQVIDLRRSVEELWGDLSELARRQIRKAQRLGFVVQKANWTDHLDHYYEVHQETYHRTGVSPHPKAYFSGIACRTAPRGNSVLFVAISSDGESVGYHNAAWLGVGAFYHTGCSRTATVGTGISYLLFWTSMLGAKEAGLEWFDCGPIFPDTDDLKLRGLTIFKTKFGGTPHRLFKMEFDLRPHDDASSEQAHRSGLLYRAARKGLGLMKNIRRRAAPVVTHSAADE